MKPILVIDDEKAVRDVLTKIISHMGYTALTARNGHEGLDLFRNRTIGLVLTDLDMPGMDGWSLASNIKKQSPGTPVLMVTGADKDEVSKRLKAGHLDGVIFKPFSVREVKLTVQKILTNAG